MYEKIIFEKLAIKELAEWKSVNKPIYERIIKLIKNGDKYYLNDLLSKFVNVKGYTQLINQLSEYVEFYEDIEFKIIEPKINALPLLLRKMLEGLGLKTYKKEFKKLRELINDFLNNLDVFYALIGYEFTQEDIEEVYKDYNVDNETDYVFKTQISRESIEKIEPSSLSKLSLEDIRLGRF